MAEGASALPSPSRPGPRRRQHAMARRPPKVLRRAERPPIRQGCQRARWRNGLRRGCPPRRELIRQLLFCESAKGEPWFHSLKVKSAGPTSAQKYRGSPAASPFRQQNRTQPKLRLYARRHADRRRCDRSLTFLASPGASSPRLPTSTSPSPNQDATWRRCSPSSEAPRPAIRILRLPPSRHETEAF